MAGPMALKITCPHCTHPHRLTDPYPSAGSEISAEAAAGPWPSAIPQDWWSACVPRAPAFKATRRPLCLRPHLWTPCPQGPPRARARPRWPRRRQARAPSPTWFQPRCARPLRLLEPPRQLLLQELQPPLLGPQHLPPRDPASPSRAPPRRSAAGSQRPCDSDWPRP